MPNEPFNRARSVAVEWIEDQPFDVPITWFEGSETDKAEEIAREALAKGEFASYLSDFGEEIRENSRQEAIVRMAQLILEHGNPSEHRTIISILFAAGVRLVQERTGTQWANSFGITKQAWNLNILVWRERLGLRKTRTMHTNGARVAMHVAHQAGKKNADKRGQKKTTNWGQKSRNQ